MAAASAAGCATPLAALRPNAVYFVPHPKRVWVKVLLLALDGRVARVRDLDDGSQVDLDASAIPFLEGNDGESDDLAALAHLHAPAILENLERRADLRDQRPSVPPAPGRLPRAREGRRCHSGRTGTRGSRTC